MREILFRGKRIDGGKWVEGYLHQTNFKDDGVSIICDPLYEFMCYGSAPCGDVKSVGVMVIPETVGQYTGLTDKNGKKIFEGDIVNIEYEDTIVYRAVINYIGSSFCGDSSYDSWELDGFVSIEVIGNTHDNPELLKGE